ncbi:MAG: response regulator [Spirochaetota bacterium]
MEKAPFKNLQVLVVDDEPAIRHIMKANLDGVGYRVSTADSAESALALASQRNFNIILSDVRMGKLSGLDMAQKMREKDPAIAFVFMTAKPETRGVNEARQMGAIQYIAKPVNATELAEYIALAGRWNMAQLIIRAATRYHAARGGKFIPAGDNLQRVKVEIKNAILASKDAHGITELAYAKSLSDSSLFRVLEERFSRFMRVLH